MPQGDKTKAVIVRPGEAGQRLDIYCSSKWPRYSRSWWQQAIKSGRVMVNGREVKPRHIVRGSDQVTFILIQKAEVSEQVTQLLRLPVIYEDSDIVAVNKPAGALAHAVAGVGGKEDTVAAWFSRHCPQAVSGGEDETRPGVVHRLDRDTSGVMVLAKTQASFDYLKRQFKEHRVKKEYLALVHGVPSMREGRINQAITRSRKNPARRAIVPKKKQSLLRGKPAITEWRIERSFADKYALLRVLPLTGRTHQIRVHLHFIGHPVVGDPLYTFKRQKTPSGAGGAGQLLHAEKLSLVLSSGQKRVFVAPLPAEFAHVLVSISQSDNNQGIDKGSLGFRTPSHWHREQSR